MVKQYLGKNWYTRRAITSNMKYYAGIINNYNSFFFNMHPLSSGSAETLIERKFKGYYIYIVKSLPIYYKFLFKYGAGLIIYIT